MNKEFWKCAGIRALRTICQTAVSMITVGTPIFEIGWVEIIAVSATAGILSILNSIATGLPEVDK